MSETTIDTRPSTNQHDRWNTCECGARYTGTHDCGGMIELEDDDWHQEGCQECGHNEFDIARDDTATGYGTCDADGDLAVTWGDIEYGTTRALCRECGAEFTGDIYD